MGTVDTTIHTNDVIGSKSKIEFVVISYDPSRQIVVFQQRGRTDTPEFRRPLWQMQNEGLFYVERVGVAQTHSVCGCTCSH